MAQSFRYSVTNGNNVIVNIACECVCLSDMTHLRHQKMSRVCSMIAMSMRWAVSLVWKIHFLSPYGWFLHKHSITFDLERDRMSILHKETRRNFCGRWMGCMGKVECKVRSFILLKPREKRFPRTDKNGHIPWGTGWTPFKILRRFLSAGSWKWSARTTELPNASKLICYISEICKLWAKM